MKKILLILVSVAFLEGCAQTTALLGPAITIGSTGNVMQAGLSFGTNILVKETTGKTTGEHLSFFVQNENKKKILKNIKK